MALSLDPVISGHRGDGTVKEEVLWNVDRGLTLTGAQVVAATVARGRVHREVRRWYGSHDILLAPTTQVLPFPVEESWPRVVAGQRMETYVEWMRSCTLVSVTGCPAISLPAGYAEGAPGSGVRLPVGVQLVAAPGADLDLLQVSRLVSTRLM